MAMNRRKAMFLVGGGILAAAGSAGIWKYAHRRPDIQCETPSATDPIRIAAAGYDREKQKFLDDIFREVNPQDLERIVFDPDQKKASAAVFEMYRQALYSTTLARGAAENALKQREEAMYVPAVFELTGDGNKRVAYATGGIFTYAKTTGDVRLVVRHEEVHARQERRGYETRLGSITGRELIGLRRNGELREGMWLDLGELEAYADDLERIFNGKDTVSRDVFTYHKKKVEFLSRVAEKGLPRGAFHPLEAAYASHTLRRYRETIDVVRKY